MLKSPSFLSRLSFLAVFLPFLTAAPTFAEAAEVEASIREGVHVVRSGDTLESLAEQYLGSSELWKDIWERNPKIPNPHLLHPGDKVVLPFRQLPERSAFVADLSNKVEQWRPPLQRELARVFDVLRVNDQLETGKRSSAQIAFPDLSVLSLNEESKVVLQPPARLGTTVERQQVELLTGQVDLAGENLTSTDSGIELVMGGAKAAPQASDSGELRTRARMAESTAQLMVYNGSSELEAAGSKVSVDEGMGSSAKKGEPPSPPEELLPAPKQETPSVDARLATPRPGFTWASVDGAESYTLEVCFDPECARLERRQTSLSETSWQPSDKLPKSELYWRVTATSPSGLDGYPSDLAKLVITSDEEDQRAPSVAFKVDGRHLAPRYGLNRHWILGRGALFEAHAEDAESGMDRWIPLLDGEEVSPQEWSAGPWQTGKEHEASFIAVDRANNRAELEPVPFIFDDQAPTLTWGLEELGPQGGLEAPDREFDGVPWNRSRDVYSVNDPHRFWPWQKQVWTFDRDPRQILIRPNRPVRVKINDSVEAVLGPERGLWILAEDAICEVIDRYGYRHALQVDGKIFSKRTVMSLEVEARDPLENRIQGVLKLETLGKAK